MRAAELFEIRGLFFGFHALGDESHAQLTGQSDDRVADPAVLALCPHACDERLVQLEDVHRIPLQEAQRRVAGAEVVQVDGDGKLAQPGEVVVDDFGVVEERALGRLVT